MPVLKGQKMRITKRFYFSASHRLFNKKLSEKENYELFSECSRNHGHNFILDITVTGKPSENTGMVMNFNLLKEIVNKNVIEHFDHADFENNTKEFENKVQTAENLAMIIWEKIHNKMPKGVKLYKIKIAETSNNWVEYFGD